MGILFHKNPTYDYEESIEESVKEFYIQKHLKEFLTDDIKEAWIDLSVQKNWGTNQPDSILYPRHTKEVVEYYKLECLTPFYNRNMQVMSIPEIIRAVKTLNRPKIFIKCIYPKKFTFKITPENLEESMNTLYTFAMYYEDDKVCLVQDLIPMEHEIRFMVFNGKILSCSAQVDEYTPLVNIYKDRWFLKTHKQRGIPQRNNEHISKEDFFKIVGRCARIVLELALENILDYSLDMCISDGQPTLVEINPLCNSGLFGNDYERFILAVKDFYLNI